MKYLSAIVLAAILLTLPGSSVMAAATSTSGMDTLVSSPAGVEGTSIYGGGYSWYPTFAITSVVKGSSVTILGHNFPPNDTFWVRMNWMGTKGVSGAIVETVTTDASGNLSNSTYAIPAFLANEYKIAIRLISPVTGYFAYNWFYNNTVPPVSTPAPPSGYSGIPTFAISAVQQDKNVTIWPTNFPPNDTFWVRLNWMHTQGIAGAVMQTVTTDANGNLNDTTYPIPDFLKGSYQIAIRLESVNYPYYYAYNWFYNNDAP